MKEALLYKIFRPFLVGYVKLVYNPEIIGKNNIPKTGGFLLVSNHKNNLDFISMGITTKRPVHFMAKNSLFKGFLKPIMYGAGAIPVDRSKKDKNCLIEAKRVLDNNLILGIFPEGTFNKSDKVLLPFKIGAVKLASETGKPIIPISILGEYKKNKLKIVIGKKIYVKSKELDVENRKLMDIMEKQIKSRSVL